MNIKLMPHQQEDVDRAPKIVGPIVNFSDTGTGKSLSSLAIALAEAGGQPDVLVVCNGALLQYKWLAEAKQAGLEATLLAKLKDYQPGGAKRVWIVSYESIKFSLRPAVEELLGRVSHVIFDEAHALKNPKSARGKAWMSALARNRNPRIQALTATPIKQSPMDLVGLFRVIGLNQIAWQMNKMTRWETYHMRHRDITRCEGWQPGAKPWRLYWNRRIRHTKAEVLPNLPPMRVETLPLPVSVIKHENLVRDALAGKDYEDGEVIDYYFETGRTDGSGLGLQLVQQSLRQAGILKAKAVAEFVADASYSEKLVVFTREYDAFDICADELARLGVSFVRARGDMSAKAIVAAGEAFKDEGKDSPRVFLATYGAAGQGIDLFVSSHVVVLEQHFDPAMLTQALNRIHRIGQTKATICSVAMAVAESIPASYAKKKRTRTLLDIEAKLLENHRRKIAAADQAGLEGSLVGL